MQKTPDEIKKGLATCSADECHGQHTDCPYHPELMCIRNICGDALALIQQLEAKNTEKDERIKQLEAEWDAAMTFLRSNGCDTCRYREVESWEEPCLYCTDYARWQWIGVQKEDGNASD